MAERKEVYKCDICGNIIEVLHGAKGELVCCGQPMNKLDEKLSDQGKEKHVPVIEKQGSGIKVKVGDVPHPMEDKHYIEWVEIIDGDKYCRKFLKPGESPEAFFEGVGENVTAREFCTVHGLWKK